MSLGSGVGSIGLIFPRQFCFFLPYAGRRRFRGTNIGTRSLAGPGGPPDITNVIEATTNFVSWTPIATNSSGVYDFTVRHPPVRNCNSVAAGWAADNSLTTSDVEKPLNYTVGAVAISALICSISS